MSVPRTTALGHTRLMATELIELLTADGWRDMGVDQSFPAYFWAEGGPLADAPVDMEKTFVGNMWVNTGIDPAFNLNGLRCAPDFSVPRHHHNLDELIIVFEGQFTVTWGADGREGSRTIGPGEFWISRAGTPYLMTAGPEGVTYIETWPAPMAELETYWHDDGWVRR